MGIARFSRAVALPQRALSEAVVALYFVVYFVVQVCPEGLTITAATSLCVSFPFPSHTPWSPVTLRHTLLIRVSVSVSLSIPLR